MKNILTVVVLILTLMLSVEIDFNKEIPFQLSTAENVQAIIGRPATPISYAGMARRTTYRAATTAVVATTAAASAAQKPTTVVVVNQASPAPATASAIPIGTVVRALPSGCKSVVVGGVNYTDCAGVFYKTAFQGNNLVYVVVESPL